MPDRYVFYGLRGELLGIYGSTPRANGTYYISTVHSTRVWLGGLLVSSDGNSITRDQLGSVVNSGTETLSYYPYGEQRTGQTAVNDREKFATYLRDENTRLDYAQARYYSGTWGRFTTADPYTMSGGMGNPQGWSRYAYVGNDPANGNDPSGLMTCEFNGVGIDCAAVPDVIACGDGFLPGLYCGGIFNTPNPESPSVGAIEKDEEAWQCPITYQNWINAHGADAAATGLSEANVLATSAIESGWGRGPFAKRQQFLQP